MRKEYRIAIEVNQLPEREYLRDSVMVRVSAYGENLSEGFTIIGDKNRMDELVSSVAEQLDSMMRVVENDLMDQLDEIK